MTPTKLLIGQIFVVFAIVIAGVTDMLERRSHDCYKRKQYDRGQTAI